MFIAWVSKTEQVAILSEFFTGNKIVEQIDGIAYRMEGSVFLPGVDLSDRMVNPAVMKMKGTYGRQNADFNEKAMQYERELVKRFAEERKAEMLDKMTHLIEWATWLYMLKAQAEEIVMKDLVEVMTEVPAGVSKLKEEFLWRMR